MKDSIKNTVERYLSSKNSDYKGDYAAIKGYINCQELTREEKHHLQLEIADHFLKVLTKNKEYPNEVLGEVEIKKTKKAYALLKEMETATDSNVKDSLAGDFEMLLFNSNLDTKVVVLDMKTGLEKRAMAKRLKEDGGDAKTSKVILESEYLNNAIKLLGERGTDIQTLSKTYGDIRRMIGEEIKNDLLLPKQGEKAAAAGYLKSRYLEMLEKFEQAEDDYSPQHPKYCTNGEWLSHLRHTLLDIKNEGEMMDRVQYLWECLQYRSKVFRTLSKQFITMKDVIFDVADQIESSFPREEIARSFEKTIV